MQIVIAGQNGRGEYMGYLVIKNNENSGPLTKIAISGHNKNIPDVGIGENSDPIPLPAGQHTVTGIINQPIGKTKEDKKDFIICEGETTTVPFGNPPENDPVPVLKML